MILKSKNIFKIVALILIFATLVVTAACSSGGGDKSVGAEYDALGMNFEDYKKEYSPKLNLLTSDTVLNALFAKRADGVVYYYGSDSILLGVRDGKIVYYAYLTSAVYAATGFPTVKGVLEAEGLDVLCKKAPEVTETQPNIPFASWEIKNGFVGISSVGSSDAQGLYSNMSSVFVVCADKSLCSIFD